MTSPETPRTRYITCGTAAGPRDFAFGLKELGFGPDCEPSDAEVIAVYEKRLNELPRVMTEEVEDFMFVDAPEAGDDDDPLTNSPDPMDMVDNPHMDAVDVCCRILRGMELAMQPWLPADCGEATLRWDQMSEEHREEYRELVLDVMADDYEHEEPQPLSPRLLRLRMATVLLNF